jgi:HSP20 family protein
MAKERNNPSNPMRPMPDDQPARGRTTMERGREHEPPMEREGRHERGLLERPLPSSPFSFMRRFTEEMDRLFEDFGFGRMGIGASLGEMSPSGFRELGRAAWIPQIEVFRRNDELVVRADLPGMRKEDVRIDVQRDHLVLQGERTWSQEDDREGVMRSERRYGSFYREVPLPEAADPEQARAQYRDGVLEVTLPLREEEAHRRRRIEID